MAMEEIKFFMNESLITLPPNATALDAARIMKTKKVGAIVIRTQDTVQGVVTAQDLARKVVAEDSNPKTIPVESIMSKNLITLDENKSMAMAFLEMQKHHIRHLVITRNDDVAGILSIQDIANFFSSKFKPPQKK